MLPSPATRRWSSRNALIGARELASAAASAGASSCCSGSGPSSCQLRQSRPDRVGGRHPAEPARDRRSAARAVRPASRPGGCAARAALAAGTTRSCPVIPRCTSTPPRGRPRASTSIRMYLARRRTSPTRPPAQTRWMAASRAGAAGAAATRSTTPAPAAPAAARGRSERTTVSTSGSSGTSVLPVHVTSRRHPPAPATSPRGRPARPPAGRTPRTVSSSARRVPSIPACRQRRPPAPRRTPAPAIAATSCAGRRTPPAPPPRTAPGRAPRASGCARGTSAEHRRRHLRRRQERARAHVKQDLHLRRLLHHHRQPAVALAPRPGHDPLGHLLLHHQHRAGHHAPARAAPQHPEQQRRGDLVGQVPDHHQRPPRRRRQRREVDLQRVLGRDLHRDRPPGTPAAAPPPDRDRAPPRSPARPARPARGSAPPAPRRSPPPRPPPPPPPRPRCARSPGGPPGSSAPRISWAAARAAASSARALGPDGACGPSDMRVPGVGHSSGSPGSTLRSSGARRPSRNSSVPAAAIIAALSVHSRGDGMYSPKPSSAAACRQPRPQPAVGRHAAAHDQMRAAPAAAAPAATCAPARRPPPPGSWRRRRPAPAPRAAAHRPGTWPPPSSSPRTRSRGRRAGAAPGESCAPADCRWPPAVDRPRRPG